MSKSKKITVTSVHAQTAIISITLVGVIVLSAFGRSAAPLAISGVAILLLLRFGIISNLIVKAFGAEVAITRAEEATKGAEEATAKVERAIEALKNMVLSEALVSISQTFLIQADQYSITKLALQKRESLNERLKAFDFSQEFLLAFFSDFDKLFVFNLVSQAILALNLPQDERQGLNEQFSNAFGKSLESISVVREMFRPYGSNAKADAWLDAAEEYVNTRAVDLDKLQSVLDAR